MAGEEQLSAYERLEEHVLLGMRLREGFDLRDVEQKLALDVWSLLRQPLETLRRQDILEVEQSRVRLKPEMLAVADGVTRQVLAHLG